MDSYSWIFPIGIVGTGGVTMFLLVKNLTQNASEKITELRQAHGKGRLQKIVVWPRLSTAPITEYEKFFRYAGYTREVPSKLCVFGIIFTIWCLCLLIGVKILLGVVLVTLFGFVILRKRALATEKRIMEQLPDTLVSLAEAMRAGFSFAQALSFVSKELPEPSRQIFGAVTRGVGRGLAPADSFLLVSTQLGLGVFNDMSNCVSAGLVSGGNIVPLLFKQASAIRAEIRSEQEIKSLTAAGRSSGLIITLLAPAIFIFFMVFSPSYVRVFWESPVGMFLFTLSVLLELLGFVWIRKITEPL